MKTLKKFIPEIVVALLIVIVYLYKLPESFTYNSDLGRDSLAMWNILHGHITLLGPKTSFGGLYVGPYYFYLFAPFLLLFKFHPLGITIGNALLSISCLILFFYFLRKKTSLLFASLAILWLLLTPYMIYAGRVVTNASTYLIPLVLYMELLFFYFPFKKNIWFLLFGLFAGIIANIHPASLLITVPMTVAFIIYRKTGLNSRKILFTGIGFAVAFLPLALFEATHHFVMIRNTFFDKSYTLFINNQNSVAHLQTSKNPFLNILNINTIISIWIYPTLIQLLVAIIAITAIFYKNRKLLLTTVFILLNVLLYSFLFRFQAVDYYLFPLLILVQIGLVYFLSLTSDFMKNTVITVAICFALFHFPKQFYTQSARPYEKFRDQTIQVLNKVNVPKSGFNIVLLSGTPLEILGYQYRYILMTLGYNADSIYTYASSQALLMISERGPIDWQHERSWEIDQFGKKQLVKQVVADDTIWYLFSKTP